MTKWVGRLLIANLAVFVAGIAMPVLPRALALIPAYVLYRPWSPVTYMFVHGGFWHLAFNMLVLYFFGPRLEHRLGSKTFLTLYMISGLTAAAFSFLTPFTAVVGASGAIYGVMLAYTMFWPRDRIYIWGILPVEARLLMILMAGYAALATVPLVLEFLGVNSSLTFGGQGIAHHAHLGGLVGAWGYMKWMERNSPAAKFKKKADGVQKQGWLADRQAIERWTKIDRDGMHEVNREGFDRIMEKLQTRGVSSLTPRERAFLDRFSAS
jgi:membrane associated rhomboid family serine protease